MSVKNIKWVMIDLSYLAHRTRYALKDLPHEDIPTGILYGFFEQLYIICKNPPVSSNKILVFTDSRKSYRARAYPEYKKKRKEQRTPEEQKQINIMYKQVNKLKNKILPELGFPVFRQVGLESDDLIAYAAKKITQRKEKGIIITSDGDLYQCITPHVQWYDPGKELLINENIFQEKKGIKSKEWGMVKAIAGCTSDCIPGLKGIGEKTAINYLTEKPISDKRQETINRGKKEIKKWGKLTILPHKKIKHFDIQKPEYNIKSFFNFCKKYGITSYLKNSKRKQWLKFFYGTFKGIPKRRKVDGKRKFI